MPNPYLKYSVDQHIAYIEIDQINEPTNLFSIDFIQHYLETAQQAIGDPEVKGLILFSARKDFMAGADLKFIANPPEDKLALFEGLMEVHRRFRALEKAGKPMVCLINGTALGGGYELSLSCHYRIALNNNKIRIGLPEVNLGLLPGGGGTQRLSYLIGIPNAATYILQGRQFNPKRALEEGYVDALADDLDEMKKMAQDWIIKNPNPVQPWDNKAYKIPKGGLMSRSGFETMIGGIGNLRKKTHGNYPGATYALACLHDGLGLDFDRGLEVEARYFIKAFYSPEAQNIIRTVFFGINEAKKGKVKPDGYLYYKVNKVGVLGAGMMGAGIAYVSAISGMQVVLKDTSIENAEKGKNYTRDLLQKKVYKAKMSQDEMQQILNRIEASDDAHFIKDCDLVIEAVFEDPNLKALVTKETEAVLGEKKIFASNTSTIPITDLAKASERPDNFIGMHFFSPVDKMPLVELIVGEKTSDYAIAAAVDYVTQIDKIPIVVNDSRGFFTSRVFGTFTREGALLLKEGVPPAMIENIAKKIGLPVGPLAITDEINMKLPLLIMKASGDHLEGENKALYDLYDHFVNSLNRPGKKDGAGFYEYPKNDKKHIWPKLAEMFHTDQKIPDQDTIGKRMLHMMALESYRCLEEGVLRSAKDGDIGSLTGFGFPPYTGGVFSYMNYVGLDSFVKECDLFTSKYGKRFEVPASLRQLKKLDI